MQTTEKSENYNQKNNTQKDKLNSIIEHQRKQFLEYKNQNPNEFKNIETLNYGLNNFALEKDNIEDRIFVNNKEKKYKTKRLENMITVIGRDKSGKGTTANYLGYSLSRLGYNVLMLPFPNYSGAGLEVEMMLSSKAFKQNTIKYLETLEDKTKQEKAKKWYKTAEQMALSFPYDRAKSKSKIDEVIKKNQIDVIITKRGSKATHAIYQSTFNNFDVERIKDLDNLFYDPQILINMTYQKPNKNFGKKGNKIQDEFECQSQDEISLKQFLYTVKPENANAKYGFFAPLGSPSEIMDSILPKTLKLLKESNIFPSKKNKEGKIIKFGSEEPEFDFRSYEGTKDFYENFDAFDFANLIFADHTQIIYDQNEKFNSDKILKKLFTCAKKTDEYAISKNNISPIEQIIKKYT